MASRGVENIRRALEAEGATEEEISEYLRESGDSPAERRIARARSAGIPALYRQVTWESVERDEETREEAIEAARRWAKGTAEHHGLYLWSEGGAQADAYGVGKTRFAAAAALEVLDARPLRWLECTRLMTDLNLSFNNPRYERAADQLRPPKEDEVIVLDDIDKMPATDRNIAPIFTLVNDCVNEEAPMILTANRSLDSLARDFGERFGEAIASRLVGHCLDVEVRGRDRRLDP